MVGTHKWSMLITPTQTSYWISLSTFHAQMTRSLHPPRRRVESVYQRCYNWWLERTNDSMLITPTQTSNWISLSTFLWLMVGTHKWLYAHYTHPDVIESVYQRSYNWWLGRTNDSLIYVVESVYQRCYNWWLERTNDSMLITPNPDVKLNQFINVPIIDGWDAQMTLCSLHPPRRHWWLNQLITPTQTSLNQFINVAIIDGWNAQMNLSIHPPRLITPTHAHYTHPDVILNQFINVPIIDGWNAQMTLCSLHPPRRHIESVYQRSYNWWLERTNDSMLITPTQTSYWISLSTLL